MPVSMRKISEITGVSIATVSRVINNNGRFSEATRKNVLSVIRKYDYTPNALAQGLRKNRTKNIGIIVPDITNEYFAAMTFHIQKALFEENYSTLICNTNENAVLEEKHLQVLAAQSVSGIVFITGGRHQKYKRRPVLPTVFLDWRPGFKDRRTNCVSIRTNHRKGGYLAGKMLLESGIKNPVVILDCRGLPPHLERLAGFKKAYQEAGIPFGANSIIKVDKEYYESAHEAVKKELERGHLHDGYFGTTDWMAIGAMAALLEKKIKIPSQSKIIGFDNIIISEHSRIPLTTVHQDVRGMAKKAVEIMMKMLNREVIDENDIVFEPVLIKRQTA